MSDEDEVRYPEVEVQLSGTNGNAGAIMGAISEALKTYWRSQGQTFADYKDELAEFRTTMLSGSYDDLLRTAQSWVTVL